MQLDERLGMFRANRSAHESLWAVVAVVDVVAVAVVVVVVVWPSSLTQYCETPPPAASSLP
jgi:hypothetical protein